MFDKPDMLYGTRLDDLDKLYTEFQNFVCNHNQSAQENISILENITLKITRIEDTISDSVVRSRLVNALPKQFSSSQTTYNLKRNMNIEDFVAVVVLEDIRLTAHFRNAMTTMNQERRQ